MKRSAVVVGVLVLLGISVRAPVKAQEEESGHQYSGDLLSRSTLTGDWGGLRNEWAEKGVTFDANVTQIEQGVVSGGKNGSWEYGGRGDITGNLDTQKAGLWPGGFLTVELESNWSSSVNGKTGALSPVNTNQLFPIPGGDNVALPNLTFAQFLSHYVGVIAGKVQTVSNSDSNTFAHGTGIAHGKGDTQFFNLAFNINPVALVVPYSTLAAGAIVLPTADPDEAVVSLLALSATGKASTSGFDNLNGAIFAGEGRVRTGFFGLTGHQLLGAFYSNRSYTSIDQRLGFVIQNRALAKKDGTWAMYYNFDQFLYETDKAAGRGIGLFGRFGASEGNPVPVQYFYSAGVGAKGLIPGRDLDQFGLGYYYSSINNPTFQVPIVGVRSFLRDEWGFEAYYNVALTPWLLLSPDVQVVGPAQKVQIISLRDRRSVGTATVLGLRLQTIF